VVPGTDFRNPDIESRLNEIRGVLSPPRVAGGILDCSSFNSAGVKLARLVALKRCAGGPFS